MKDFNNTTFIYYTAMDFLERSSIAAKDIFLNPEMLDVEKEGQIKLLGKMPFPMTAAAFSMELALKGLLMDEKIKIPKEHDLKKLFYLLPESIQSNIVLHYQTHNHFKGYPNMYIKIGDKKNIISPDVLPAISNDTIYKHVNALLEKHKSAFIDFRYFHEFGLQKSEIAMDYKYFANFTYSIISILGTRRKD